MRYERLSALDESFLAFETRNAYMHVAMTSVFEVGSLALSHGGVDMRKIRSHIASRLTGFPRYRQRLMSVPVLNDSVWVDDPAFELDYHVRHVSLPRPGGDRQLRQRVAEILERPLDRARPLWEFWIIEGLAADRFALLAKVHHCMVDGIAGVDLLVGLLSTEPVAEPDRAARWEPSPAPEAGELLRSEVSRRARDSLALAGRMRRALSGVRRGTGDLGARAGALWRLLADNVRGAPPSALNEPIGPHRRVSWLELDLGQLRAVKERLGGTVNDVVLAVVNGALRRFLVGRGDALPEDFRVLVPVSVRTSDERGVLGNRVSLWVVPLPIAETDAREAVKSIRGVTDRLKTENQALGAKVLTEAANWASGGVVSAAARLIDRLRAFNLIVTNVPGPPVPLYLLGARLVAGYPHVMLFENQCLGVALLSYAGRLFWGLTGDWNRVADLDDFARAVEESFADICATAGIGEAPGAETEPPRRRTRRIAKRSRAAVVAFDGGLARPRARAAQS